MVFDFFQCMQGFHIKSCCVSTVLFTFSPVLVKENVISEWPVGKAAKTLGFLTNSSKTLEMRK